MINIVFLFSLALTLGVLYIWGFRHLSRERWQVLACLPLTKLTDGRWQALNLTYYGFFNATACLVSVLLVFILLTAGHMEPAAVACLAVGTLVLCLLAAKWVSRWVEKKAHTFSVGGASFVGFLLLPWILLLLNSLPALWPFAPFSVMRVMAALSVGYTLGEGMGRLACLSFGCCYGRRMDQLPRVLAKCLAPFTIRYSGATKKIAYAHGMAGFQTLAVQPITTVLYSLTALVGTALLLYGYVAAAFVLCVLTTQIWRVVSEFLRADYRGQGRISAYQIMAGILCLYAVALSWIAPEAGHEPLDLTYGLAQLWSPSVIMIGQGLWIAVFIYLGVSRTTAATIHLFVRSDRI